MSKESAKNHSPNPRSSAAAPRAMAFGRNYFYCMGGTSVSHFRDEHIGSLTRYTWDREPWNKHNKASNNNNEAEDSVEQVACSAQATLFLTKSGKIYQTGTIHGRMYKTPCPINIPLPLKCVQISAGRHFCLGRMEGGLAVVR
jgi:alpha-tubulin suppressor-like RCC1 family protein